MSKSMTDLLANLEADAVANMPNLAANIASAKAATLPDEDAGEPDPTEFEYSDWSDDDGAAEVV